MSGTIERIKRQRNADVTDDLATTDAIRHEDPTGSVFVSSGITALTVYGSHRHDGTFHALKTAADAAVVINGTEAVYPLPTECQSMPWLKFVADAGVSGEVTLFSVT